VGRGVGSIFFEVILFLCLMGHLYSGVSGVLAGIFAGGVITFSSFARRDDHGDHKYDPH
jgi:hypothetical protein